MVRIEYMGNPRELILSTSLDIMEYYAAYILSVIGIRNYSISFVGTEVVDDSTVDHNSSVVVTVPNFVESVPQFVQVDGYVLPFEIYRTGSYYGKFFSFIHVFKDVLMLAYRNIITGVYLPSATFDGTVSFSVNGTKIAEYDSSDLSESYKFSQVPVLLNKSLLALGLVSDAVAMSGIVTIVCVNVNTETTQNILLYAYSTNTTGESTTPITSVGTALPVSFITEPASTSPVNMIFPFDMVIRDVIAPPTMTSGKLQLWQNGIQTGHFFDLGASGQDNSGRAVYDVPLVSGTQLQFVVSTELIWTPPTT